MIIRLAIQNNTLRQSIQALSRFRGQKFSTNKVASNKIQSSPLDLQYQWPDPKIRKIIKKIRAHYFPIVEGTNSRPKAKKDDGIPLNKALEAIFAQAHQMAKTLADSAEVDLIFEAKCRLAGEKYDGIVWMIALICLFSSSNGLRGVIALPKPPKNDTRILVICGEEQRSRVLAAGATYVGGGELVTDILEGKLTFDRCIATTDQLPILAKLARILGPQGLMPTVKTGTLTTDAEEAVRLALRNTPFKIDKDAALFRLLFARSSYSERDALENLKCILDYLQSHNKTTEDGKFIEEARLLCGSHMIVVARSEYGQASGPKFMVALERLRAQVAARKAALPTGTASQ